MVGTAAPGAAAAARLAISWLTNATRAGGGLAAAERPRQQRGVADPGRGVFGVLNTIFKPLLLFITFPLAILTLGIAWFFVALLMLDLTDAIVGGFSIDGFWTLVLATVIVWLANLVLDADARPVAAQRPARALQPQARRP